LGLLNLSEFKLFLSPNPFIFKLAYLNFTRKK